ncbi:MAG: phosphopentomutase [Roseinatronobacter sp.]
MARAFLVVLDSVGCGGAPDAAAFGDAGANTLGHIISACAEGRAQQGRRGPLRVPVLDRLGLGAAVRLASGVATPGLDTVPEALWGAATETSRGKDTPSGHWELAGLPVPWDWTYFPQTVPAFPPELIAQVCALAGTEGILGNCHASGIPIINRLGAEHLRSGWPICYTSADSVFQIAAHEDSFGLDRLHRLCADLAPVLHRMRVGRVIARPFSGTEATGFTRTGNRRDYAMTPPGPMLMDWAQEAGLQVNAVGKIADIFSGQGVGRVFKGKDDMALFDHFLGLIDDSEADSLTFCNFVEFDSLYGHTRDVSGYARALERFDRIAGVALARLRADDLLIITADHGNDPTAPGSDHTRERVPVLAAGAGQGEIGLCGFVDVAASIAAHLGLRQRGPGRSFLP